MPRLAASRSAIAPALALLAVTAIWGSTFFLIKDLLATVPPLDFLGVRFAVAALIMVAIWWRRLAAQSREAWRNGLALGAIYALAQIAQTWGLERTPASVSGFVTGMYVVLTPIVVWAMTRISIPRTTQLAVLIATIGLGVLSLKGISLGIGESATLLGAALYALHIVLLGRWAVGMDAIALAGMQMISLASICLIGALPGGVTVPASAGDWASLLYMAIAASIGALVLQTWAQARISASRAAIIMTAEPVFAASFAVAFGGEHVTGRLLAGGALIYLAMHIAERPPGWLARILARQ